MRIQWGSGVLGAFLWFATAAAAKPDLGHARIFFAEDGARSWQLIGDDQREDVFYRLPEGFGILPAPGGKSGVTAQRTGGGDLLLTFAWGPVRWPADEAELKASILRATGREPHYAVLFPTLGRMVLDPDLADDAAAEFTAIGGEPAELTPGSAWLATLRVPAAREQAFVKRVVLGAGFSSLVSMAFRVEDPALGAGVSDFPYSVSFFVGGLQFCEVRPELACP